MIGDILQPTHLLFILVVALLVLGPKRLPEAGRALGRGIRDFRSAINGDEQDPGSITSDASVPPAPVAVAAPAVTEPVPPPAVPESSAVPDTPAVPETLAPPPSAAGPEGPSDSDQATEHADQVSNSAAQPTEPAHISS